MNPDFAHAFTAQSDNNLGPTYPTTLDAQLDIVDAYNSSIAEDDLVDYLYSDDSSEASVEDENDFVDTHDYPIYSAAAHPDPSHQDA